MDRGKNRAAMLEVVSTVLGKMNASSGPIEEPHADVAFQRREHPHNGGQRRFKRRGRGRQRALLDDSDERPHRRQLVHELIITSYSEAVYSALPYLFIPAAAPHFTIRSGGRHEHSKGWFLPICRADVACCG